MPEEFDATRTSFTSSQTSPATPEVTARYTDSSPAFGPYRLVKTLGEGGMGQVWEAEHQDTSRIVALKIAHSGLNSDEDRERFIREARLAASISHRNCVFVFGAVESNGALAIAMELVRGGTVKDLVKDGKPIHPQEAVRIAIEMIDGLDAAHAKGILHRDIKPANIFIDSDSGAAKVGDFGLSTSVTPGAAKSPELSTLASFAGTPSYASPEQLQGRDLDVRSDIYSVGATLYYLLAGRPPFTERDLITLVASISARNPDPPSKYNPQVPADVDAVVLKCLAKNPAARYTDYASFRNALTSESPAPIGRRLLAGMIDSLLADGMGRPISRILWASIDESPDRQLILLSVYALVCFCFGALEGVKGWSPGKLALGLHVRKNLGPPGLRTGLLRSAIFFPCQNLPSVAVLCFLGLTRGWHVQASEPSQLRIWVAIAFLFAPFVTARRRNGWAALHDKWTSTHVTVNRRAVNRVENVGEEPTIPQPLQYIGPFQLFGESRPFGGSALHNGWDSELRRRVSIVVHPPDTPTLALERRDAQRRGCLRWIMGERAGGQCWDAYEMPDGSPLDEFVRKPVPVAAVSAIVADLCEELGHNEETDLDMRRVWVTRNGRGVLRDFPASLDATSQIVPKERFLDQTTRMLTAGNPPPLALGSILSDLAASGNHQDAAASLRSVGLQTMGRVRRMLQLLLANFMFLIMLGIVGWGIWSATHIQNLEELPAALQRISETKDPTEKTLLTRYVRARFLAQNGGPLGSLLERALADVGVTDAKAKLAQITTPPATPEEVATTRPIVQKLAAQSKYSNIRITVKARDVVGPLWAAVSIQFLVGLLASLITGVPLSFWLTGLALTNFAGTAAPRWRAAARCAIPLAISAGGLFLTRNAPLARPVVPTLLVIGFAVTIWNYRRGPFERLLGLWVSPR